MPGTEGVEQQIAEGNAEAETAKFGERRGGLVRGGIRHGNRGKKISGRAREANSFNRGGVCSRGESGVNR